MYFLLYNLACVSGVSAPLSFSLVLRYRLMCTLGLSSIPAVSMDRWRSPSDNRYARNAGVSIRYENFLKTGWIHCNMPKLPLPTIIFYNKSPNQ